MPNAKSKPRFKKVKLPKEKEPLPVKFTACVKFNGKQYDAGAMNDLMIGGAPLRPCVAMHVAGKKWAVQPVHAIAWLVEQGLPEPIAKKLIDLAMEIDQHDGS